MSIGGGKTEEKSAHGMGHNDEISEGMVTEIKKERDHVVDDCPEDKNW